MVDDPPRMMWITPERVFYYGLLGKPSTLVRGARVVYVADAAPLRLRVGAGPWREARVVVVQPCVRHQVASAARHVSVLMVEPETVDSAGLPRLLRADSGPVDEPRWLARFEECRRTLCAGRGSFALRAKDFDLAFFGMRLAPRELDPRIEAVAAQIRADPAREDGGRDWARTTSLSYSHFLHLFATECGVGFRSFRAWKRARSLLNHVTRRDSSLTHVALDIGYPDATHFSHSIRRAYGLRPRDIFAGSRRLALIG